MFFLKSSLLNGVDVLFKMFHLSFWIWILELSVHLRLSHVPLQNIINSVPQRQKNFAEK